MTPTTRHTVALTLTVLVTAGASGCSSSKQQATSTPTLTRTTTLPAPMTAPNAVPAGRAGTPRGGAVTVANPSDVDQVADAVASAMFRYDTALDNSPQDAARRAAAWMTPALAAEQATPVAGGGAWWNQLAAGHGWTTTTLARDTEPPATFDGGSVGRRVFVTVTAHTAGGVAVPAVQRYVVAMVLTRTRDGWRASSVQARTEDGTTP